MKTTLQKDFNLALENSHSEELSIRAVCHFLAALERYRRTLPNGQASELRHEIGRRELLYFPTDKELDGLHARVLQDGIFVWCGENVGEDLLFIGAISMADLYRVARSILPPKYMMTSHNAWACGKEPLVTAFLSEK